MSLCLVPMFGTLAADTAEESKVNDDVSTVGICSGKTSSIISYRYIENDEVWKYNCSFSYESNTPLYISYDPTQSYLGLRYIVRNCADGYTPKNAVTSFTHNHIQYISDMLKPYDEWKDTQTVNGEFSSQALENVNIKDSSHSENKYEFHSTLPIFDKSKDDYEDNVMKYLESGDTSGCENEKDLDKTKIDDSIEVPHGLKISGEFSFGTIQKVFHDKLLSFGWSIPEMEDLSYDAQFKFNYLNKKMDSENGIDSDWYNWRDNIKYNYDSAAMILDVVNKIQGVNWLSSARTSLGLSMDDCYSITFRVRNRKGDKVSNWVEIQLGQDGKATVRETDLDGNTKDSDEYNEDTNPSTNDTNPGSNDFYDWVKDNTDNANNSDSSTSSNGLTSSIKDLKAFITSGFGLLGSNGIIALMSGLFSYIPASVWTLIKAAISMTILVMLIGLLKNLVFG